MQYLKTLPEYCAAINVSPPRFPHFDVRSFAENMPTVVEKMPPFRHEFYAIAIKREGGGQAQAGLFSTAPEGYVVFFNSPYQIISWDIKPDWEGYYLIFSQEFVSKSSVLQNLLLEFPFLRMDQSIPFAISEKDMNKILSIFERIYEEYYGDQVDRMKLIQGYTYILLNYIKRYYDRTVMPDKSQDNRNQDLQLVSRYQTLIEINLAKEASFDAHFNPHATAFYAEQLHVHPNHLNTLVKRVTGKTALKLLHHKLLEYSQSFLLQTGLSIKEIAFALHFKEAAHFINFFKKNLHLTPQQYREQHQIATKK